MAVALDGLDDRPHGRTDGAAITVGQHGEHQRLGRIKENWDHYYKWKGVRRRRLIAFSASAD